MTGSLPHFIPATLLGLSLFCLIIAAKCFVQAWEAEKAKRPKFDIFARIESNEAQVVVRNMSTKTIDNVEVKASNQRVLGKPQTFEVQSLLTSLDGRSYPISFNPKAPLYFTFAWPYEKVVQENNDTPQTAASGWGIFVGSANKYETAVENSVAIKITVAGKDSDAVMAQFLVSVDAEGKLTLEGLDAREVKRQTDSLKAKLAASTT